MFLEKFVFELVEVDDEAVPQESKNRLIFHASGKVQMQEVGKEPRDLTTAEVADAVKRVTEYYHPAP